MRNNCFLKKKKKFMCGTIDLKYGIFTQIQLFLQQLKQCPTKRKKINNFNNTKSGM